MILAIYYYFAVPALSIYKISFWVLLIFVLGVVFVCTLDFSVENLDVKNVGTNVTTPVSKYIGFGVIGCLAVIIIGGIISSTLINSSKYA